MIVYVVSNTRDDVFSSKLNRLLDSLDHQGWAAEIQYSTTQHGDYGICHSALVIGRPA